MFPSPFLNGFFKIPSHFSNEYFNSSAAFWIYWVYCRNLRAGLSMEKLIQTQAKKGGLNLNDKYVDRITAGGRRLNFTADYTACRGGVSEKMSAY